MDRAPKNCLQDCLEDDCSVDCLPRPENRVIGLPTGQEDVTEGEVYRWMKYCDQLPAIKSAELDSVPSEHVCEPLRLGRTVGSKRINSAGYMLHAESTRHTDSSTTHSNATGPQFARPQFAGPQFAGPQLAGLQTTELGAEVTGLQATAGAGTKTDPGSRRRGKRKEEKRKQALVSQHTGGQHTVPVELTDCERGDVCALHSPRLCEEFGFCDQGWIRYGDCDRRSGDQLRSADQLSVRSGLSRRRLLESGGFLGRPHRRRHSTGVLCEYHRRLESEDLASTGTHRADRAPPPDLLMSELIRAIRHEENRLPHHLAQGELTHLSQGELTHLAPSHLARLAPEEEESVPRSCAPLCEHEVGSEQNTGAILRKALQAERRSLDPGAGQAMAAGSRRRARDRDRVDERRDDRRDERRERGEKARVYDARSSDETGASRGIEELTGASEASSALPLENRVLKSQLEKTTEDLANSNRVNERYRDRLRSLETELEEIFNQGKKTESYYKSEIERLTRELDEIRREFVQYKLRTSSTEKSLSDAISEKETMHEAQIKQLQNDNQLAAEKLKEQIKDLKIDLCKTKDQLRISEADVTIAKSEIELLHTRVHEQHVSAENKLNHQQKQHEEELHKITSDCEHLALSLKKIKGAYDALKKSKVTVEDAELLEQAVDKLNAEIDSRDSQIQSLIRANEDFKAKALDFERKANDNEIGLNVKAKTLEEQNIYIDFLNGRIESSQQESIELREAIASLTGKLKDTQEIMEELKRRQVPEETSKEWAEMKHEIIILKTELGSKNKTLDTVLRTLDDLENEQKKEQERHMRDMRAKLEAKDQQVMKLQQTIQELQVSSDTIQAKHDQLEKRLKDKVRDCGV
ncbi:hypothetical protein GNI_072170 [Gregarina niphandrodes]|uniref:Uncharacterized protein n=1 Tax=Gregarina niphandrodes TaxID=110365 RepID=A0A023B782_GRENI|nr:hypothetical protein GNI_072170 [Gregarina niphandrodes]EZG67073.1 hypothetical protein GNI_072170 [Gregarina niphandrodes]|eukprot:XP_011130350.1 hypothetical protein GNI_072170 [Gregarina niphandrodes]